MNRKKRIEKALDYVVRYGGIDGDHHAKWVIDQMVRALTGCPMIEVSKTLASGEEFTFLDQGESEEYKNLVKETCAGEDGPNTYDWPVGIPP